MLEYLGFVGLILILVSWIPQTLETVRTKRVGLRKRFILLQIFGSLALAIHAYQLNDLPFLLLNALVFLIALMNFYYRLIYKR